MTSRFEKDLSKFRSFKWYRHLSNGRKAIRNGICHSVYWYANASNNYMEDYDKHKDSLYIQYCDVNNLHGWAMSQNLPVNKFDWTKDASPFNEDLIIDSNEESDEEYFYEVDVQYLGKLVEVRNDLPLLPERRKIEKSWKACC